MMNARILWADDEISLLKPQIVFLEQKGLTITAVTNGADALEALAEAPYDLVFLDEHMPGLGGLATLQRIATQSPTTPVVMITKSEEEHLMEDAIGARIADYLIKPVNPHQILHTVKRLLEGRELAASRITQGYQQDFRNIDLSFQDRHTPDGWAEIYKKLTFWEMELAMADSTPMDEVLLAQKTEANLNFCKFYSQNYLHWVNQDPGQRPLLSPDLMPQVVIPRLRDTQGEHLLFLLIDSLRYDQWKVLEQVLAPYFQVVDEQYYYAMVPTATQFARNSIFSGLFPMDIAERYPQYWVAEDAEEGKNMHEEALLRELLNRRRVKARLSYTKVVSHEDGRVLADNAQMVTAHDLSVWVVNFIDIMTHARAEMSLVKELTPGEAAMRSLAKSWLEHSSLLTALKKLRDKKVRIILTTDHGSIRVKRPIKILADRNTTSNLRYKHGRNLNYDEDNRLVFTVRKPQEARLPRSGVTASYAFALEDGFFVYPNNYNYYAAHYADTFQHGGISLEEVIVPLITLVPRG